MHVQAFPPRRCTNRSKRKLAALAVAVGLASLWSLSAGGNPKEPAAPRFLGVILTRESVDIAARSDGRVATVLVRLGHEVRRDQTLARLEQRREQSDLAIASALLRGAEAEADRAVRELDLAQDKVRRNWDLYRSPSAGSAVSDEEIARANIQVQIAQARLLAARASVEERRARVEQGRTALEEAEIRAPFDGTITHRYADSGSIVMRGTPILRLISRSLLCRFAAPEQHARRMRPHMRVLIEAEEGETPVLGVYGEIEKVAPEVDSAARLVLIEARLDLDDEKGRLLAGRVARVSLARTSDPRR